MFKTLALILSASFIVITGCSYASPDAGHEAVLIEKPIVFGHGGVEPDPVHTGAALIAWTTTAVDVNMMPQRVDLNFNNLMTSDGVPVEVDTTMLLRVTDSVRLIREFGPNWYGDNIQSEYGNRIRQEVRVHGLQDLAIQTTSIEEVQAKTKSAVIEYVAKKNMPIEIRDVIIGKVLPPDAVKNQRIETAQQEQRLQTETQRQKAEDARKGAETSRASADNAYRNSLGLSSEQFVQLENINMQHDICAHHACTFFIGGSPIVGVQK